MSNRRKLRPRLTAAPAPVPELRRMTVRNERGEDVSWLFGVPPELRGVPRPPGPDWSELDAARADPRPFTVRRRVRLVDELGGLVDEFDDRLPPA